MQRYNLSIKYFCDVRLLVSSHECQAELCQCEHLLTLVPPKHLTDPCWQQIWKHGQGYCVT